MINTEVSLEVIQKKYKQNYYLIENEFLKFQNLFLTDLYKEFKDFDTANIFIYISRSLHEEVLKNRIFDLKSDISYDNFTNSIFNISQKKNRIIEISREIGLPKETTRRKINNLIKQKIIKKINKKKDLIPSSNFINRYKSIIVSHNKFIVKILSIICNHLDIKKTKKEISDNFERNYSFYIYNIFNNQIKFINIWNKIFKDFETLAILMQFISQTYNYASNQYTTYENNFFKKKIKLNEKDLCIRSSLISKITGIPRVTCIRKIEKLVKLKLLKKNEFSKAYFLNVDNLNTNKLINFTEINNKIFKLNCNFYFLSLKRLFN